MLIFILCLVRLITIEASSFGGFLNFKQKYLYDSSISSNAQEGRLRLYYENKWNDNFMTKLEGRTEFTSTPLNLSSKVREKDKEQLFDLYPGESFFKIKFSNVIVQIGYQEIVWGESFGFNSADFITPKNQNFTFLSELEESRRPIPLIQTKYIVDNFSLQLIYGPKATFEKDYPVDLYFRPFFVNEEIQLDHENIAWFKKHEGGAKASLTLMGYDFSLFGYSYLDRKAVYEINNFSQNSYVNLIEKHYRTQSVGSSVSTTIGDLVLRGDYIRHNGKRINYINSQRLLSSIKVNENILSIGIDTPSYDGFSFFLLGSLSALDRDFANGFRNKKQNIFSLKVQKEFDSENKLEIVGFSELEDKSNGLQVSYSKVLTDQFELLLGAESYFGDNDGTSTRLKKYNSVFIKLKNYFNF